MKKVRIETFGCQMNKSDSEKMYGLLSTIGYRETEFVEDADLVIVDTCSIRKNAVNRLMGHLSNYKTLKKYNPDLIIAVAGCVPQHEKENIRKKAPWVNIVFGSQNFNKIHEMVKNFEENRKSIVSIVKQTDVYEEDIPVIRDNKYTAWVTVMNGCSRYCTFCIVSYVTTNYSPRPGTLVAEMEDQIPEEEKYKMSNYLNKIVQKIAKEKNCQEIGKIRTVLVKGFNKEKGGKFYGRTRRNKLVHFECDESMLGKIVDIKITDATVASLRGEVMKLAKV